MDDTIETSAQKQARIRREKREAKIKGQGQDRLNKITQLSGRTPENMRNETPLATPPRTMSPAISPAVSTPPYAATPTPPPAGMDADQIRAQEEFIRALLRSSTPQDQQQQGEGQGQGQGQMPDQEDPMMKMMASLLGNMNNDPNAPPMPSLNPEDISNATGLPSFVTSMMMGSKEPPPSPAEQREARLWTTIHILFAVLAGIYTLFTVGRLTESFGVNPPAPATFQNPASVFILGEILLYSTRAVVARAPGKSGFKVWIQKGRDIARDASVMIFMLGIYSWLHRNS